MARVKGVKEPLVKTAMLRRPLAVIQIQDEKAGDQNWHRAAQGIRQGAHRTQGAHAAQPCHAAVQHRRPVLVLESAHPSPLSAYRGFFGSAPFGKINAFLQQHGEAAIDWLK